MYECWRSIHLWAIFASQNRRGMHLDKGMHVDKQVTQMWIHGLMSIYTQLTQKCNTHSLLETSNIFLVYMWEMVIMGYLAIVRY